MNLSNRSVVLLCILLLCDLIYCMEGIPKNIDIELPINESVKTIEIKIIENIEIPSLSIKCLNYDALHDLNGSILKQINWTPQHGKWIIFKTCFNNETAHDNYKNFELENFLNTGESDLWDSIDVRFDKFGFVDENEFLKDFKFPQYKSILLYNVGFASSTFLTHLISNTKIKFANCNQIDFNHFTNNTISSVEIIRNNILNFNANNLRKFSTLRVLELYYNNFNGDVNVFNVGNLFELNPLLFQLYIENSDTKLVFHENVFAGLHNLELMALGGNQLENIPKNLFHDLTNLRSLILDKNMLTNLDENTFLLNKELRFLSLDDNKLFKFSGPTNNLNFGSSQLFLSLHYIKFNSIAQLQNLVNNPSIGRLFLSNIDVPQLGVDDFRWRQNSTNHIVIKLDADTTYFNMPIIPAEQLTKPKPEYGTILRVDVEDGSRMCHECDFIKQVFPSNEEIFVAQSGNILFEFVLSSNCRTYNMLEQFYRRFDQNCPSPCTCAYNEFIDKVRIDCSNKNLTNIPIIMYPTQFNYIDSIDLVFRNNLLSTVEFTNQNIIVMEKLSTLDFENNKIDSLNMDGNPPKLIHYFNLCNNPVLQSATSSVEIRTVDGVEKIENTNCFIGTRYLPDLNNIVQKKSEERVKELLETCV